MNYNNQFILKTLFSLVVHVGHFHYSWNNSISNLVLGKRKKIIIFNLVTSLFFLRKLYYYLSTTIKKHNRVLFLSNSDELSIYSFFMQHHALNCNELFTYKFTGFMSNWNIMFKNFIKKFKRIMGKLQRFKSLSLILKKNNNYHLDVALFLKKFLNIYILYLIILFLYNLTRFKQLRKLNKIEKAKSELSIKGFKKSKKSFLTKHVEKIKDRYNPFFDLSPYWRFYFLFRHMKINKIPSTIFFINFKNSKEHISEFHKLNIALISVVDSNSIIANITYPILGNDDSFICNFFYSYFISETVRLSKFPKWWNR